MSKEPFIEVVQSRIEMRMYNHGIEKYSGPITVVYGSNIAEKSSFPLEFITEAGIHVAKEDEESLARLFHNIMGESPEELLS